MIDDPLVWAEHLRSVAGTPATAAGHDLAPVLLAALGRGPLRPPEPPTAPELVLGWARTCPELDVDAVVDVDADGPLLPEDGRAIEVWTDAELSAVHALWWLARDRGRMDLDRRTRRACAWHLENTQADHATHLPWALHVFVAFRTPEALQYAGGLLHAAQMTGRDGHPDAFPALILLDAADALELLGAEV